MWSLSWPKNTQNVPRGLEVTRQLCLGQQGKLRRGCGVIVSPVCQVFRAWLSRHVVGLHSPGLCFPAPCWLGEAMSLVLADGCERKWCGSLLGGGIHCWRETPQSFLFPIHGDWQCSGWWLLSQSGSLSDHDKGCPGCVQQVCSAWERNKLLVLKHRFFLQHNLVYQKIILNWVLIDDSLSREDRSSL